MATHYVRSDAAGGGDGSADTSVLAWTLTEFQALGSGDFADNAEVIFTGNFTGTTQVNPLRTGMTLRGHSAADPARFVIDRPAGQVAAFGSGNITGATWKWLDIAGTADTALLYLSGNTFTNPTLIGVHCHDNKDTDGRGIRIEKGTQDIGTVTLTDCSIGNCGDGGALIRGATVLRIKSLYLYGNGTPGVNSDGIQVTDAADGTFCGDVLMEDCVAVDGKCTSAVPGSDFDIGPCTSAVLKRCKGTGNHTAFSTIGDGSAVTLESCIGSGSSNGFQAYSAAAPTNATVATLKNCTLVGDVAFRAGVTTSANEKVTVTATNCVFVGTTDAIRVDTDAAISVTTSYCGIDGRVTNYTLAATDIVAQSAISTTYQPASPLIKGVGTWIAGVLAYDGLALPLRPDLGAVQDRNAAGRRFGIGGGNL